MLDGARRPAEATTPPSAPYGLSSGRASGPSRICVAGASSSTTTLPTGTGTADEAKQAAETAETAERRIDGANRLSFFI